MAHYEKGGKCGDKKFCTRSKLTTDYLFNCIIPKPILEYEYEFIFYIIQRI